MQFFKFFKSLFLKGCFISSNVSETPEDFFPQVCNFKGFNLQNPNAYKAVSQCRDFTPKVLRQVTDFQTKRLER